MFTTGTPRGAIRAVRDGAGSAATALIAAGAVALLFATALAQAPPPGRINPLIAKLEAGQTALTPTDWMFIDMEHGPYLLDRLQTQLADLGKRKKPDGRFETAPIVRIPLEGDEDFRFAVKQVLDMGAMGVVFPHVETRAQAVEAIRSMRYPPQRGAKHPDPPGRRGWGPGRAATLWGFPVNQYAFERADVWPLNPQGELFAMIMIETAEGVKHINDIITVPGVGAIFIGASDLGVSLGVGPPATGGVNHPETEAAVQSVLKACKASRVTCAYPVLGGQTELAKRTDEGFKVMLVAGGQPAAR
jgi:4-hydroxy-2-oxoheptanedioate aldolase